LHINSAKDGRRKVKPAVHLSTNEAGELDVLRHGRCSPEEQADS
jgi:hypothetical protein